MKAHGKLHQSLARFVGALELVFHEDWEYAKGMLGEPEILDRITADGSFLRPGPEGRVSNWGALDAFYEAYGQLREQMAEAHLEAEPPEPDDWFNYGWPS